MIGSLKINCLIIIAPSVVNIDWIQEAIPIHSSNETVGDFWKNPMNKKKKENWD